MCQAQGFIRVFFSSHNLSNGTQSKFQEAEGISGHISIEVAAVHQSDNQTVRHSVLKQVALHAEGTDFTADGQVGSHLFGIVSLGRQIPVHGFIQTKLTQMKTQLHITFHQSASQSHSIEKQVRTVEMKLHLDFYPRHQHFAGVKHFQVRGKHQTVGDASSMLGDFCHGRGQGRFVIGREITPMLMRCSTVGVVGGPLG